MLQYAESMDAPAYEDGPAVEDTVPNRGAALAFAGVEYGDLLDYCRRIIGAAMGSLPPAQAVIVRLHYLDSLTLEDTALRCGMSSKQAVKEAEERALDRLARGNTGGNCGSACGRLRTSMRPGTLRKPMRGVPAAQKQRR